MKKEDFWFNLIVAFIVVLVFLFGAFVLSLPKLWASNWDFKCLFTECRRVID